MKIAIYPGTFDPITVGHLDIINRALNLFDSLIIALAPNAPKAPLFSLQARHLMLERATAGLNVRIEWLDGLLVDFAAAHGCAPIIRGLRAVSDFEYELQMHYANASLCAQIETIYLMPSLSRAFVSSSIVRSIFAAGGDAAHLVPAGVWELMSELRNGDFCELGGGSGGETQREISAQKGGAND